MRYTIKLRRKVSGKIIFFKEVELTAHGARAFKAVSETLAGSVWLMTLEAMNSSLEKGRKRKNHFLGLAGFLATFGMSQSCHGLPAETLGTGTRPNIQSTGSSGTFIYGNLVLEIGLCFEFKPFFVQATL